MRTIVYRDEVPHNFPKPHTDLLEQFIDYQVPPDKTDELARYGLVRWRGRGGLG